MHRIIYFAIAMCALAIPAKSDVPQTSVITGGGDVPIAITQAGPDTERGIVFIHSLLASSLHWEKQLASDLADSFKLIAADMRGHGASGKPWDAESYLNADMYADDIATIIEAGGLEKPVLVAWSYGGLYAMDYIRKYGTDNVSGVVLVASTAGFETPPPPPEDTPERRDQKARNASPNITIISEWTDGYVNYLTGTDPSEADDDFLRIKVSSLMTPHYVRPFFGQKDTDNRDLMKKLELPVLFIVGSNEVVSTPEQLQELSGQLPQSSVSIYEDQGNMPFWYDSEKFNRELEKFAKQAIN